MMEEVSKKKPVFVQGSPDISEKVLESVIEAVIEEKAAGIIAVNTFPQPNLIAKYGQRWEDGRGGLSGNDQKYRSIANRVIATIYNKTQGKVPIMGVGGVNSTE